jgi:DNA-binding transcriptional LysR family regulator
MGTNMSGPSFAEISAFVTVLEQTSFANAAKHLGLSPPRVSELVRSLEERVGVRLVERTTRSVAPTEAGEQLLAQLRHVLDDYQTALESLGEFRKKPAGVLRLTAPAVAVDFVLAPLIAPFLALYPDIKLDISTESSLTDIVARRFDAGIRLGDWLDRDMIAVQIADDLRFVIVAAPSYLARRGTPANPRDLIGHDIIRFRSPSGELMPLRFQENGRKIEAQVEGKLTVSGSLLPVRAAIDGVGLLQVPLNFVAADIAAGRLAPVLDDWAPLPMEGLHIFYPSRRQMRPALKAFLDFLRNQYRASSEKRAAA